MILKEFALSEIVSSHLHLATLGWYVQTILKIINLTACIMLDWYSEHLNAHAGNGKFWSALVSIIRPFCIHWCNAEIAGLVDWGEQEWSFTSNELEMGILSLTLIMGLVKCKTKDKLTFCAPSSTLECVVKNWEEIEKHSYHGDSQGFHRPSYAAWFCFALIDFFTKCQMFKTFVLWTFDTLYENP